MKKRLTLIIAIMAVLVLAFGLVGCSLLGNTTDQTANGIKTVTTYNNVSQSELEEALTKYREIAETLSDRVTSLEDAVRQSITTSKANIGAYAVTYVDSVMSLTCADERYISVSANSTLGCQGTGFIITEDGYVITNNHVIYYDEIVYDYENLQRDWFGYSPGRKEVTGVYPTITATFDSTSQYYNNGKNYTLQFIYRDSAYDLALCKLVEEVPVGSSWKAIPFYEGEYVRGDELLVLGNARGDGLSATSGIISATGRTFTDSPQLTFIQTDAAINGGNSGGPAINIYGGLVGVVNSKYVSTNIENMGFAIELDKVKEFLTAAQTNASVTVTYKTVSAPTNTESVAA